MFWFWFCKIHEAGDFILPEFVVPVGCPRLLAKWVQSLCSVAGDADPEITASRRSVTLVRTVPSTAGGFLIQPLSWILPKSSFYL